MKNLIKWPTYLAISISTFLIYSCGGNEANAPEMSHEMPMSDDMHQNIDTTFRNMFEEVNVVKMHLFGTNMADPKQDEYPYTGKPIAEAYLKYLGEGLQPNEIGSVYACYRTEIYNFYILRVPGKYASSDLVLAKWNNATSKLEKIRDLASLHCDEGICHQQDAWLTDLDDDRVLDLITRSATIDNGKVSDEKFEVYDQPDTGAFAKAPDSLAMLAPETSYVLHHEMSKM
ncbi:MAG: hypothetical protein GC192_20895 [Bacteroidetes bacterium]|nr:hypothetical protein [Bacteroidota bacterium]